MELLTDGPTPPCGLADQANLGRLFHQNTWHSSAASRERRATATTDRRVLMPRSKKWVKTVIYDAYQTYADAMLPMRSLAAAITWFLEGTRPWFGDQVALRGMAAGCNMFAHAGIRHNRPSFSIDQVVVGGREDEQFATRRLT